MSSSVAIAEPVEDTPLNSSSSPSSSIPPPVVAQPISDFQTDEEFFAEQRSLERERIRREKNEVESCVSLFIVVILIIIMFTMIKDHHTETFSLVNYIQKVFPSLESKESNAL